jgi:hypothetical protein
MATHSAAYRNTVLAALIGGFVLVAGATAAHADDDDWHSEAERPVAPQQQIKDRTAIQAIAAVKPQHEQVYAPRSMLPAVQIQRQTDNDNQTATVDRPQH